MAIANEDCRSEAVLLVVSTVKHCRKVFHEVTCIYPNLFQILLSLSKIFLGQLDGCCHFSFNNSKGLGNVLEKNEKDTSILFDSPLFDN